MCDYCNDPECEWPDEADMPEPLPPDGEDFDWSLALGGLLEPVEEEDVR